MKNIFNNQVSIDLFLISYNLAYFFHFLHENPHLFLNKWLTLTEIYNTISFTQNSEVIQNFLSFSAFGHGFQEYHHVLEKHFQIEFRRTSKNNNEEIDITYNSFNFNYNIYINFLPFQSKEYRGKENILKYTKMLLKAKSKDISSQEDKDIYFDILKENINV